MRKFRADADERFRTLQRNRVYQKRLDTRTAMATEEQNMRNYTAALARRQLREEERIARRQQRELERVRREQEVAQARRQRQLQLQALTESKASLRAGTGGPGMVAVGAVLVSIPACPEGVRRRSCMSRIAGAPVAARRTGAR